MRLFELAKKYSLPLEESSYMLDVPREIYPSHHVLKAKRMLNIVLRFEAVKTPYIGVGELVDIFLKPSPQKR